MKEYFKYSDDDAVLKLFDRIQEFDMFSRDDIKSFMEMGRLQEYEPGELIIREGEFDCWVYFLLSGYLQVLVGNAVIGTIKKRGEVFGEMGIIDGSARSTTVQVLKKSIVLGVDCSLMDREGKAGDAVFNYTLYKRFAETMAERLRALTEENSRLRAALARAQSPKAG